MGARMTALGIIACSACVAFGQSASGSTSVRTISLTGGESPQQIQELVNIVRSVAEIQNVSADAAHESITLNGTTDQNNMAAWVVGELDQPTRSANLTYVPPGGADSIVRIFYLAHAGTPRQTQEMINSLRSNTEVTRIMPYNRSYAIVLRGTQAQAALAEWMIKGLDLAPGQTPAPARTPVTFASGEVAQIFYLTHAQSAQQLQEIINTVRSLAEIPRLTAYNSSHAINLRATAEKAAAAAWMVGELDKPAPQTQAMDSYLMQGAADGVMRVFYLPSVPSGDLQQLVTQIRSAAPVTRIVTNNAVSAVAIRGTAGQIAIAEQLVQQRTRL